MARGTWQGSGTWQTTSSGGGVAVVVIAVIVLGSGAMTAALSALAVVIVAVAAVIALAVATFAVILWRKYRRQESAVVAQLQASREARAIERVSRPQVVASQAPAIEQHVHYHVHVGEGQETPRVIRGQIAGR